MKTLSLVLPILISLAIFSCSTFTSKITEQNKKSFPFVETEISSNSTFNVGESIELSMKVTNKGKTKFTFLPWGTPIENSLTGDCLLVKYNNQPLDYIGIMVKRIPPTKKDYVVLKQNNKVSGKINVLDGYRLNRVGSYTVQYKEGRGLPASNIVEIEVRR